MAIREIQNTLLTPAEIRELDGAPVLDPEECDRAIIGTELTDEGFIAVYDYDVLIQVLSSDGDAEGAQEWVEFNTLPALGYMGSRAPIVLEASTPYDDGVIRYKDRWWTHR